jgi:hypothetical protein
MNKIIEKAKEIGADAVILTEKIDAIGGGVFPAGNMLITGSAAYELQGVAIRND